MEVIGVQSLPIEDRENLREGQDSKIGTLKIDTKGLRQQPGRLDVGNIQNKSLVETKDRLEKF